MFLSKHKILILMETQYNVTKKNHYKHYTEERTTIAYKSNATMRSVFAILDQHDDLKNYPYVVDMQPSRNDS